MNIEVLICFFGLQNSVVDMMKKIYPNQFPVSMDDSDPYADIKIIKQNFMKVAIYYEDLNQELVSQIPVYTVRVTDGQ